MSRRADSGSNARPDGEFTIDTERPAKSEISPGVYVVTQRPASLSTKLLPPLLLVMVCAGFLAYRNASADWRGISVLTEWFSGPASTARLEPPVSVPPALALNTEPEKPPAEPAPETTQVEPAPKVEIDPLGDIQRESEKEKARIAELEKIKAREEEKFAATEAQRRTEQQREKLRKRHGIDPRHLAQIQDMQREIMRRHQEMFERLNLENMDAMADMRKRFLGRDFPIVPGMPMPGLGFGLGMIPPPPMPGAGDGKDNEEVVQRTPDGGIIRFRRSQGPNGATGFELHFRSGNGNKSVPPPPRPGLRGDDEEDSPAELPKPLQRFQRVD